MRTMLLSVALVLGASGCLDMFVPGHVTPAQSSSDMGGTGGNGSGKGDGTGSGDGSGNGNGSGTSNGGAGSSGSAGAQDMGGDGGTVPAGTAAFGALCTVNGDCQSAMCAQFAMGTVHRCTKSCTTATAATDCPAPSDGTCNNNNQCKFDQ